MGKSNIYSLHGSQDREIEMFTKNFSIKFTEHDPEARQEKQPSLRKR